MSDIERPNRPQHDQVAEDMDIMTHQEAAARFFDAIEQLQAERAQMISAGADEAALNEVGQRIRNLEAAARRVTHRASPVPPRSIAADQLPE